MLQFVPGESADDDVDLTNLIDLMVTLAALLMLLLPTLPGRLTQLANLPESPSRSGEIADIATDAVVVRFSANKELLWNEESISLDKLVARARELPEPRLVNLAGTDDAPYGLSVQLRLRLAECGVTVQELARIPEGDQHAR